MAVQQLGVLYPLRKHLYRLLLTPNIRGKMSEYFDCCHFGTLFRSYLAPLITASLGARAQDKAYNRNLARERVVIEQVNRCLKIFRILAERYRNRRRRFGLRCNLIAALYNYEQSQSA